MVFDRIRELRGKSPYLTPYLINTSINQTLSRTIITSFTTLIVVVILTRSGGQGIRAFAFSLIVGVLVGTWLDLHRRRSCFGSPRLRLPETGRRVNNRRRVHLRRLQDT